MRKSLKLIPALCMLLISAMLVGTSTYAWFTMNKTVTAVGLNVKARAEGGIVIARTGHTRNDDLTEESITMTDAQALLPTSTADASTWFHAAGTAADNYAAEAGSMKTLTLGTDNAPTSSAAGIKGTSADTVYVLYDTYTIYPDKNSTSYTDLWVSQCTVSGASANLSKALRVAYVAGSNVVICAPVNGATTSYTVGVNPDGTTSAGTSVSAVNSSASATTALTKAQAELKSGEVTSAGLEVNVYVYFEGEDQMHNTNNLNATGALEDLTITSKFTCTSVAAAG